MAAHPQDCTCFIVPPKMLRKLAQATPDACERDCLLDQAEISAHLHVHLGIARVLVSDLVAHGHVAISDTDTGNNGPDLPTLERLLDDLKAY